MLYQDMQTFVRRINDDGTVADIPKDIANADYQEYIKTVPLERRIATPTEDELSNISLRAMLAEVLEGIGITEAYATLVILKKRKLGSVPEKWRSDVRSIVARIASDNEISEVE
jgi:hypothetical protein